MELSGKIALVTGANRGLGSTFVEALVERGATVYAAARDVDSLTEVVASSVGQVVPLELDVTNPASIKAAALKAGNAHMLINNAGRLEQLSLAEAGNVMPFRAEMEVNVFGLAQTSLAFAPVISRNGGGAIVNILSTASLLPFSPFATYSASKAAAMSLTHSMRWDFHKLGVQMIGVYAGFIDTGMIGNLDVEKTSPEMIVEAALLGIEAGQLDIATDNRSAQLLGQFRNGYDDMLDEMFDRADLFRKDHPATRPD